MDIEEETERAKQFFAYYYVQSLPLNRNTFVLRTNISIPPIPLFSIASPRRRERCQIFSNPKKSDLYPPINFLPTV